MAILERVHLEIIRAVKQYGSLTAAAETLHLSQSALSHSIRKLEQQVGVNIWRREGRTLHPTQAGEYLLGVANRLAPQFVLAEKRLTQFAQGERGTLHIGMECHPCYQWLLKITARYLSDWPTVDLDIKQKFQFGGIDALLGCEIDLLVTPDPLYKKGLMFEPVFDYEQVLVVGNDHPLKGADHVQPSQLIDEVLITYPVPIDRLDIYSRFLMPAGIAPRQHKLIETTDIMLQMVASGRGVAALPGWVVAEHAHRFTIYPVKLGKKGIDKQIFLGFRKADANIDYLHAFLELAREHRA
ncbi:MAG: LysR family transcriptional regulator [Deltaproteobacteria bacterium]|nr:MAG: LysR family transcriptional regulator [Deltaproteobacteria bacterium]